MAARWKSSSWIKPKATSEPMPPGFLVETLKELYGIMLYGKDEAKYNLINKFSDKVSARLKNERAVLRIKGQKQAKEMFQNIVYKKNPFLDLIKTHSGFSGTDYPVLLVMK